MFPSKNQSPRRETTNDQSPRREQPKDQTPRRKTTEDKSARREPIQSEQPKLTSTIGVIETPIEVKSRSTQEKQPYAPEGSLIYPDNLTVQKNSKSHPPSSARDVITIGEAPDGVQNKTCIFLGPDTIQKIIEEARL